MAKTLAEVNILDLLPQSIAQDSQFQAASTALDTQLQSVQSVVRNVLLYARLDELEDTVLDLLGWQLSVDVWSPDLSCQQKRALIRGSIAWHRKKGTPWAVKQLLGYLGYAAEIASCAEARSTWTAAGGAKLDGRAIDGSWRLVPWRNVTGVDYLEHWAEFSVKFDLGTAERASWNDEIRWAVNTAKPVRCWPVFCYLLALLLEVSVQIETSAYLYKDVRLNYPFCSLRLDGSWQVGYDAALVTLNGRALDGSWQLSQIIPGHATVQIRQCTIDAELSMRKQLERPARYFFCKLNEIDLRLDGCWQLGRNHVLARGHKYLTASTELPGLRGVDAVQRTRGRIVYPTSPAQLSTIPKINTFERLNGRWQIGAPRKPVRRRLDGSWPVRTPGLKVSTATAARLPGCCGLYQRLDAERCLDGSWQIGATGPGCRATVTRYAA